MTTTLIGDRYEILGRLGSGGMGEVFRAKDTRLLRDVAIKILKAAGESEEALFFFHREARALASLRHPGIVQIFDYSGPNQTPPYIVMDLLEGGNLKRVLAPLLPLPVAAILSLTESVASALAHAHEHGVAHRDIKPDNIMFEPSGHVVLTDFGLAKPYQNPLQLGGTLANRVTGLHGTPAFLAPEQIAHGTAGPEADIFALGSVVYWLSTGVNPFGPAEPVEMLRRIVSLDYLPLRKARPDLDEEVHGLVAACHAKEPSARPEPSVIAGRCQAWRRARRLPGPAEILAQLPKPAQDEATRPYGLPRAERRDTVVDSSLGEATTGVLAEALDSDHPLWADVDEFDDATSIERRAAEPTTVERRAAEPTTVDRRAAEPTTVDRRAAESTTVDRRTPQKTTLDRLEPEPTAADETPPGTLDRGPRGSGGD